MTFGSRSPDLRREVQGSLRLIGPLACADGRAVCDHVRIQAFVLHLREEAQGNLWLFDFPTCDDGRVVCDQVRLQAVSHFSLSVKGLVWGLFYVSVPSLPEALHGDGRWFEFSMTLSSRCGLCLPFYFVGSI